MTVSSIKDIFEGINSASSTQKKIHALIFSVYISRSKITILILK